MEITLGQLAIQLDGLLVGGGVVYTLGVAFHLLERLRFHNVIWHGFVLAAACLHYAAVVDTGL